jgi:hypothetical protein
VWGRTEGEAIAKASKMFKGGISHRWSSAQDPDWDGPPIVWVQWAR